MKFSRMHLTQCKTNSTNKSGRHGAHKVFNSKTRLWVANGSNTCDLRSQNGATEKRWHFNGYIFANPPPPHAVFLAYAFHVNDTRMCVYINHEIPIGKLLRVIFFVPLLDTLLFTPSYHLTIVLCSALDFRNLNNHRTNWVATLSLYIANIFSYRFCFGMSSGSWLMQVCITHTYYVNGIEWIMTIAREKFFRGFDFFSTFSRLFF